MTFMDRPMSDRVRSLVDHVRSFALTDAPDDPVDRALAAVTLLAGAAVLGWPKGRALPEGVGRAAIVARHLWVRRHWWLPGSTPPDLRPPTQLHE